MQSLWIGAPLSKLERLCIQSFLDHGHEFHLYVYADIGDVPKGAVIKDAGEILPKKNIFTSKRGGLTCFADWFRYELLCIRGGFWVDTDVICIKPFDFGDELIIGKEAHNVACSAVIGGQNELITAMRDACRSYPKVMPWDNKKAHLRKLKQRLLMHGRRNAGWGEVGGPPALSAALKYFDLFKKAKPHTYFYPIHHANWDSVFDHTFADGFPINKETYCIHLWNEMLSRSNIDKNANFPPNSLIEQFKRKHGIR